MRLTVLLPPSLLPPQHPLPPPSSRLACAKLQHSEYDWGYFTEPQDNACRDFTERRSFWPRGKVLGGCSSINYMACVVMT